jgi:hypothetical protein
MQAIKWVINIQIHQTCPPNFSNNKQLLPGYSDTGNDNYMRIYMIGNIPN